MRLVVNGKELFGLDDAGTLAELTRMLDLEADWVATAVNGELVRACDRARHRLREGDRIEILSPVPGG